jgi:hypothetical protein
VTFWILSWKGLLIFGLAVFSVMTVCVSVGGALDIRRLFQRLRSSDDDESRV